jgi:hypothetical protein
MTKIVHNPDPIPLRQKAAPGIEVQLDALWEIVDAIVAGKSAPADATKVLDTMRTIHTKFAKGK